MRVAFVLFAIGIGCVEPKPELHCGTEICPLDSTCVDGSRCVAPNEIAACSGTAIGAACTVENLPGRCTDHSGVTVCDPATCGDGVVDEPLHEACDGSAGAEQCLDLGFDLGRPTCDAACSFDTDSCARFGWKLVTNAPVTQMWTDGTTLAYLRSDPSSLSVHGGGFEVDAVDAFGILAGGAGHVFVTTSDGGVSEVGPSALVQLPAPPVDARMFTGLSVDVNGVLWAVSDSNGVFTWDGSAWAKRNTDGCSTCSSIHTYVDHLGTQRVIVMAAHDAVYELLPSGSFNYRFGFPGYGFDIGVDADDSLYAASSLGFWELPVINNQNTVELSAGAFVSIARIGNDIYSITQDGTVVRWNGTTIDRTEGPTIGALASDGATLYEYGGPIFSYSGTAFGSLPPVPLANGENLRAITTFPDGTIEVASDQQFKAPSTDGSTWVANALPYGMTLSGFAGINELRIAVVGTLPLAGHAIVAHYTDQWHEIETQNFYPYVGVWMAQDQSLVAVASDGHIGVYDNTANAWTETAQAGCSFEGVSGLDTTASAIAVGTCNGFAAIWSFTDTWHPLYTSTDFTQPLAGVKVFSTGQIVAVGDSGVIAFDGTSWSEDPTVPGRAIDATGPSDVWIAGSFTNVQHFNGTAWSQMTTRALGPMFIAAQADRISMPGSAKEHVTLLR